MPPSCPLLFDHERTLFENAFSKNAFFENFANFWRARSRLYQNEILQENMRLTAFFKLYKICILLHRCNLKIFAKNRFEKLRISQNFWKFSQILANSESEILLIFWKNVILELCKGVHCVDLDESFQTHIYLQNLASIQPRTSPLKFVGSGCEKRPASPSERGSRSTRRRSCHIAGFARFACRWKDVQ